MPWYEFLPYKTFDRMVIESLQKAWNLPLHIAQRYYDSIHKRSCYEYENVSTGMDEEGSIYYSTRLAIVRILSAQGVEVA